MRVPCFLNCPFSEIGCYFLWMLSLSRLPGVGNEKGKSLAHGDLCKQTKAPADAAPAEFVAPEAPLPAGALVPGAR